MENAGAQNDPRWQAALRVAGSEPFRKAVRLRKLLLHLCQHSLQGSTESLHEQEIGCEVFERHPGYSTADDNIVRVNAAQLRKRLREYYSSEGKADPILISIPKGSYVPLFAERGAEAARRPIARPRLASLTQVAVIAFLATACVVLWLQNRNLRLTAARPAVSAANPLWAALFDREHETDLVAADANVALLQDILRRPLSLADYLKRDYPSNLQLPGPADRNYGFTLCGY
jgi:hypothetical protein